MIKWSVCYPEGINVEEVISILCKKYKINLSSIKKIYDEPHRFYHNWNHISNMFYKAMEYNWLSDELGIAILFHDIIYDPKRKDNEEKSCETLSACMHDYVVMVSDINEAIMATKTHIINPNSSVLISYLCDLDMEIVYSPLHEFIEYEKQISKEYQFVNYDEYRRKRIEFLESVNAPSENITYVRYREPSIAVYAGSFNPFHIGHLNILEKAEQIFDKVIIAIGNNPDKNNIREELPKAISYRQIDFYDGLLTDYLKSLNYPATLIRGLRDANDLLYESTQISFLKDLMPEIKVIEIICDREFNHVSSSAIRNLRKFDEKIVEKYTL